ncbi:UNVERIFIED_CONTAM: hypothetical protein Sindi_2919800 [Sesamum indicum]
MHAKLAASSTTWTTGPCPVGPHFVAQISPFSVDSGAFSIVGRIRDESAVGSHGEIYRGWGCAERSRKKQEAGRVGGAVSQKGVQHEDFPGGPPILRERQVGRTSNLPGGVNLLRTGGATPRAAYARESSPASSTTWTTGLAPVGPHFVAQISHRFRWIPARFRSLAAFVDESAVGVSWGDIQGLGCAERSRKSRKLDGWEEQFAKRGATRGLPRGGATGGTSNLPGGVTLRTGGATPRAAYAREARRELHDVDNWACPVGPHFVAQISPFSVDSGAFSIVGRIRDESAVGSHGEIYRGWGARNGREKSGKLDGWEEQFAKRGATRGLPRGSPILVLLSAQARLTSDGATGGTSNLPGGVTLRTGGATPRAAYAREARRELHDVDNWACPVGPHFVAQISTVFGWIPARFRSLAAFVMSRPWGLMGRYTGVGVRGTVEKKQEAGRVGGAVRKKGCNTRTSQGVTHPSTTLAQARLTSDGATGGTSNLPGGRNFAHWWSYAASSLMHAKLAAELHDVDNWACPVGPHFRGPNFAVFGGFRRVFDSLAAFVMSRPWGLMGRYTGVGVRGNGREKAGSWTGGRRQFAKRGATRGLPRGSPIPSTTLGPSTLNFGVLMGSGALVLRSDRWDVESSGGRNFAHWWSYAASSLCTRSSPRAPRRGQLGLPPLGHISWPKFRTVFGGFRRVFDRWAAFVMSRPWGLMGEDIQGLGCGGTVEKKQESWTGAEEQFRKKGCNTRTSQGCWYDRTPLRYARFNLLCSSSGATGGTSNLPGGVTLRTGGAYAAEQPMHAKLAASSTTWTTGLAPLGHISWPKFRRFRWDSGAFSIVGRIRDEGWGVRNGREKVRKLDGSGGAFRKKGCNTRTSQGVTHPSTTLAQARLTSEQRSDRWDVESSGGRNFAHWVELRREQPMHAKLAASSTTWTTGLAPLGHISWPKFHRFRWIPARFSIVGRIRDESAVGSHGEIYRGWGARNGREKKQEAGRVGGAVRKKGCNTRTSQGVTHPSTTLAQARLTSDGATGGTSNLPGGVTLRTGGATPRAAYAREARRELHDVDNWACPVGPHFVAQISPFSVDSGAFSIVGRIRDESAVGSHGEIYRGWGCAERSRKSGKLDGWEEQFAKRGATRGLPRGTLNFGVLMGSGALVLRSDRWDVESSGGRNFAALVELRREQPMHAKLAASSTTWTTGLAPLGHISWPKFQPFSVDSGAFSIVGRIRDESAVGSHGEIYRGWGARNGREKAGSWTGGRSSSQKGVQHEDFPGDMRALTFYALAAERQLRREQPMHAKLAASSTTWTTGLAPLGHISWPKFRRFRWIPARFRSLAAFVMSRPWGLMGRYTGVGVRGTVEKKQEAGRVGGAVRKKGCNTRTSQGVTHPSTTLAQARLTSDGATGGTSNLPGGVTLRTGGATPRAAYAREARRELHDVDNWACPVGPHFVAQISPFSVDSGAFSIVGRIRDESAVGSHGEIYRGWGARNGREKAGSWTGGRSSFAKRGATRGLPRGYARFNLLCSGSGATGGTSNLPGGVTLRTGGATPRAAYAREARRELHDVDNWACPVGPHFVAQISPFSVDSGAFSIVGRIRDESAVGSHGEIYRGWGARNGREKAGSWTGGRSSSQKGVQHEDFPGGHPSYGATGGTSNLPGGVTLRTGGATPRAAYAREARRELHDVDNWACPVGPHFVAQISPFSVDSGAFSIVGRIRDESAVGSHGEIYRGWGARNGREKAGKLDGWEEQFAKRGATRGLPRGYARFNLLCSGSGATGGTSNLPGGVTLRTGGATPRAAYAREARRELHDVDNWACPVGPHFVAQISPFSVDSGAFSIVGRIRDESAVGSHGEIYRGWGARNGREKAGSWTGGRSSSQKGVQHEDFPGGHPSYGATGGTSNLPGGVTLRTGGATPRAAYAREARRELHDVDNWACPVGPHFVAQISPFSVDSGAFSIVGRIRDESAVGSHGEIYRGWGVRGTVEKKQEAGRVGGAVRKKGCNTRTSQGVTHPSTTLAQARLTSEF